MSTKIVLGALGVLVAVILVGWGLSSTPSKAPSAVLEAKPETAVGAAEVEAIPAEAGTYEAYAPAKLALAEKGKVILFFRASWCPTCRGLDADIRANLGKIPKGTAILDINYDTATELKQKYGVTYQHTLVQVDVKGNQLARWTGSPSLAALLAQVK